MIVTPRDLPEDSGMRPGDLIEKHNPVTNQNEKVDFKNWNKEGLYLNPNRIAMQELTSSNDPTNGWITIAESTAETTGRYSASFDLVTHAAGSVNIKFNISACASTNPKTFKNTTVEIVNRSAYLESFSAGAISSVRLAKSDSNSSAGFKVQIKKTASIISLTTRTNNLDVYSNKGFQLVTPYLDNTPILPDGVTAATFLEAGAELSFNRTTYAMPIPKIRFLRFGAGEDVLRCMVEFPFKPKLGTSISISAIGGTMQIVDYAGNIIDTLDSFSISNLSISDVNNEATFLVNKIGIGTGVTINTLLHLVYFGGIINITITG